MKSLSDLQNLLSEEQKSAIAKETEKRNNQMLKAKEAIKNLTIKEMNVAYFPAFIRMSFQGEGITTQSNALLITLGDEFKIYLKEKYKGDIKKLEDIWNIEPIAVVRRQMSDPFAMKGYHPALLLHFCDFMEKMKKQALKQLKK
jgi:hypothetical protein